MINFFSDFIILFFFQAANLLKRTEGLVSLVVSKPGKKDQSRSLTPTPSAQANNVTDGKALGKTALKTSTTLSRPTTPVPGKNGICTRRYYIITIALV